MQRRNFFGTLVAGGGLSMLGGALPAGALAQAPVPAPRPGQDRAYMAGLLQKIAEPVLSSMARGALKREFDMELSPVWDGRDRNVGYLECFGRLMSGCAPWLALPDDASAEGRVRKHLRELALQSFVHAVDPKSPDYLAWGDNFQVLVDSAYFTSALMRAPRALWDPLDRTTKERIIARVKDLRRILPLYTNWLLFAAMNEAFLLSIGEAHDPLRLNTAIDKVEEWYVGDGWIKDGEHFHFDYYDSFVIYPMLIMVLEQASRHHAQVRGKAEEKLALAVKRAQRLGEHLERFVSPIGTFPPLGRSATYRTGAFQVLAFLAWRKELPASLPEGQVRAALQSVHQATWAHPSNFSAKGFLTLGFTGHQPSIADVYSNSGSMYIATESFLALGLPENDSYWTSPAQEWTQQKAYSQKPFPRDGYVSY
jgi:hypothetical protein